ncbi:hypothetical protein JOB18_020084 [Solea senegalensis]|uniref:Uncharacterized protein n=1 Tax=Solea senegalensis TaxID=28829 RepID=A0AAV6PSP5_SOLSE|nr:hypothetical protein JOB18_020084 [Solea senegalensis]
MPECCVETAMCEPYEMEDHSVPALIISSDTKNPISCSSNKKYTTQNQETFEPANHNQASLCMVTPDPLCEELCSMMAPQRATLLPDVTSVMRIVKTINLFVLTRHQEKEIESENVSGESD